MLGENLKKAISRSKLTNEEFSEMMGISKGNLYNLFKKDTFEVKYVRRASEILGIPISNILDYTDTVYSDQAPSQANSFGEHVITQMSKNIDEIREYFEQEIQLKNKQLEAKDRQIEKLLDLLGKLEGANWNQLFQLTGDTEMDLLSSYKVAGLTNNILPSLRDIFLPQPVTK